MSATEGRSPGERPPEAELGSALEELAVDPGLCRECDHLRLLRSSRSIFVRCALAASDERFPRYPPLPVRVCPGFSPRAER